MNQPESGPDPGPTPACNPGSSQSGLLSIRVVLPYHLCNLARIQGDLRLEVPPPATIAAVLDAIEARHPNLRGTLRDHDTRRRRPFIRFFACREDLSHVPVDTLLPEAVTVGREPFLIVGAMAGG